MNTTSPITTKKVAYVYCCAFVVFLVLIILQYIFERFRYGDGAGFQDLDLYSFGDWMFQTSWLLITFLGALLLLGFLNILEGDFHREYRRTIYLFSTLGSLGLIFFIGTILQAVGCRILGRELLDLNGYGIIEGVVQIAWWIFLMLIALFVAKDLRGSYGDS